MWLFLIPFLPLLGFLLNGLGCRVFPRSLISFIGCSSVIGAFGLALQAFSATVDGGELSATLFEWIRAGNFSIEFALQVDRLTAIMLLVVTGVGSIIHIYSMGYMHDDPGYGRFFAYLNLFMGSMLLLVMGKNLAVLFLGWEGVGLCSYLLIGFWFSDLKNSKAGEKAFIVNRIGDLAFLLGLFFLIANFGTLDIPTLENLLKQPQSEETLKILTCVGLLFFIGACGKSAQVPLYVWLPDAMAGPTAVSALIHAATMVTAGVYMICRLKFLYLLAAPEVFAVIGGVAAITAIFTAMIAMAQNDIKKVLAYSTISQLGYMFMALSVGAFSTAVFHLATHAFFKALLFLGAGAIIHALHGEQDIRKMGGLLKQKELRLTCITFIIGALAIAGFPFLAGFYSKDQILAHLYHQSTIHPDPLWGSIWKISVLTAMMTAFYMFRMVALVCFGKSRTDAHTLEHVHKPDWSMHFALVVLAILSVIGGHIEPWIAPIHPLSEALSESLHHHHSFIVGVSVAVAFGGILLGLLLYLPEKSPVSKVTSNKVGHFIHQVVLNKFYVDEIYYYTIVWPLHFTSALLWYLIDRILIDTILVNGVAWVFYQIGYGLKRASVGVINLAAVVMVVGSIFMFGYILVKLY